MRARPFDLGLTEEDERALREARRASFEVDLEAAFKLMADVSSAVDAAVRRRPLLTGAPFKLPGHVDERGQVLRQGGKVLD
jgi:hypothetical protein